MRIEQKQELVQSLVNFFKLQYEGVTQDLVLSNMAYFELKSTEPISEVDTTTEADLEILMTAFDKLSACSEKFQEILSLLEFELEADFDHLQLFNALKDFVGDDELRLAQLEILFNIGTIH